MTTEVSRHLGEVESSQDIAFARNRQKVSEVVRPLLNVKKTPPAEVIPAMIFIESKRRAWMVAVLFPNGLHPLALGSVILMTDSSTLITILPFTNASIYSAAATWRYSLIA